MYIYIIGHLKSSTEFVPQTPEIKNGDGKPIRIVFLLTLNGRALRQVYRLINALYRTNHYFYIHIDKVSIINFL